jgi:TonB family protein
MFKKSLLVFITIHLFCYLPLFGQQRTTTKLNRHFLPIEEKDTLNHQYNQVETISPSGETVTWTFDLQNRMVKKSKIGVHPTESFNQEIIENFDSTNNLSSQKIYNLDNMKYVAYYYREGVKKAQVIHHGKDVYEIWRNNPDSIYTSDYNDFDPGLNKKVWNSFLVKNLRYPNEARKIGAEGTVVIGILVDKEGNIKEAEIANSAFVNSYLEAEALRVVMLYKGKFIPAKNINGKLEEVWINIPIRFKLG